MIFPHQGSYIHRKEVVAAQGVKIIAKDLDNSLAGLPLHVAYQQDEIEIYKVYGNFNDNHQMQFGLSLEHIVDSCVLDIV